MHHAAPQGGVTEIAATEPAVPSVEIIDDGPAPTAGQPVPPGGWMVRESWVSLSRDDRSYTYLLNITSILFHKVQNDFCEG